jgi:hypothetical protein
MLAEFRCVGQEYMPPLTCHASLLPALDASIRATARETRG